MELNDEVQIQFLPNGVTCVFHGRNQVESLQQPWLELYAEFLMSKHRDPAKFALVLPDGRKARFFPTARGGWNWEIQEEEEETIMPQRAYRPPMSLVQQMEIDRLCQARGLLVDDVLTSLFRDKCKGDLTVAEADQVITFLNEEAL